MPTDERGRHAETIIRNHVLWAAASGAIPVAIADMAAVSAVQLDMVRQLCGVYDVDFSATKGKALVSSLTSAVLSRVAAASVAKMVPIAGTLIGSVTGGVLSGASAYATGHSFKQHFATGGTILDLDPARFQRFYREQFEKGKEAVQQWQTETADGRAEGGPGTDASEAGASTEEGFAGALRRSRFHVEDMIRRATTRPGDEAATDARDTLVEEPGSPQVDLIVHPRTATAAASPGDKTSRPATPTRASRTQSSDLSARLTELKVLHERGLINAEDYESTKARLLGEV